jgi:hypothetical protein
VHSRWDFEKNDACRDVLVFGYPIGDGVVTRRPAEVSQIRDFDTFVFQKAKAL